MIFRFLWLAPLLALASCNRAGDDFLPPAYHPASPLARAGAPLPPSSALAPEPAEASPRLGAETTPAPAPAATGGGHGHHQH